MKGNTVTYVNQLHGLLEKSLEPGTYNNMEVRSSLIKSANLSLCAIICYPLAKHKYPVISLQLRPNYMFLQKYYMMNESL